MLRVWKRSPILRLLTPFVCGILLQIHVGVALKPVLIAVLLTLILFAVFHFFYRLSYHYRFLHGVTFFVVMLGLGVIITQSNNPRMDDRHIANLPKDYDAVMIRLTEAPVSKENSVKSVAEVLGVIHDGKWSNARGLLLVYLKKDSSSLELTVDDKLWIKSKPSDLLEAQNPFEFNYKKYLYSHYIYNQVYASGNDWQLQEKAKQHSFFGYFISWRENMLSLMRSYGVAGQEYAVLSALVLGKTSEIDYHLMLSYASAGAIHILAVSGLHVALIYMLLSPISKRLFPRSKYKFIKTIVPVFLLWLYAGITGFSPSVLRAAWMFTFFIISDNYAKENNIYNTMSASAIILLWWNPYIIMEVGFQLSYIAVLGIVVLQKRIESLYYSRVWIVRKAWSLTAVSIAAQLSTFSLGLLYFHQFPNWFLVSNLFVIPLSTFILFISLGFFAFSWFPPVAHILIRLSEWLTWLMNESMLLIDRIPYSITQGISITVFESYLIAGITISVCYWLLWIKPKAIVPALCLIAALCITQIVEKTAIVQHKEICIHHISGHNCITYSNGENGYILFDGKLMESESRVRFHLKNYWDHLGIKQFNYINLDSTREFTMNEYTLQYPFLTIGDKRFAFVDSISVLSFGKLRSDYYIFNRASQSIYMDKQDIETIKQGSVILSDGLSKKKKKFLVENSNKGNVYDLTDGALIIHNKEMYHFSSYY